MLRTLICGARLHLPPGNALAQMSDSTYDEDGQQRRGEYMQRKTHNIEQRKSLHKEEKGSEDKGGSCDIPHITAPLHGMRRRDKALVTMVGRREDSEQTGSNESEECHGSGTLSKRIAEDIDDDTCHKSPHHIHPSWGVAVKHQHKIHEGHGSGIAEDVDVVEHQHLQQGQHNGKEEILEGYGKHGGRENV